MQRAESRTNYKSKEHALCVRVAFCFPYAHAKIMFRLRCIHIFAFLAGLTIALPAERTIMQAIDMDELASYMSESDLATPYGLRLKYVLLGVGTQNYTCAAEHDDTAPGTTGATGIH